MTRPLRLAAALLVAASTALGCARGADVPLDDEGSASLADLVERVPSIAGSARAAEPPSQPAAAEPEPWVDPPACSDATQFVYVLSAEGEIHRFSPRARTFERVGRPACLPDGVGMFSMAVDRRARAFVLAHDQRVYRVDLATGACEPTVVERADPALGFRHFGMAFVGDPSAPDGESLFIREAWVTADDAGIVVHPEPGFRRLATLDTRSGRVELRGTGEGIDADLTGTGDGRLFGFYVEGDRAAEVGIVDTRTGALGARWQLPGLAITGGWAVAAWGSELWLFSSDPGETARARRFRPDLGVVDLVSDEAGFHVVGAGVSTCASPGDVGEPAPIEPPS